MGTGRIGIHSFILSFDQCDTQDSTARTAASHSSGPGHSLQAVPCQASIQHRMLTVHISRTHPSSVAQRCMPGGCDERLATTLPGVHQTPPLLRPWKHAHQCLASFSTSFKPRLHAAQCNSACLIDLLWFVACSARSAHLGLNPRSYILNGTGADCQHTLMLYPYIPARASEITSMASRGVHPGCGASQAKFLAIQGAWDRCPVTAMPRAVARAVARPAHAALF